MYRTRMARLLVVAATSQGWNSRAQTVLSSAVSLFLAKRKSVGNTTVGCYIVWISGTRRCQVVNTYYTEQVHD